MLPIIILGFLIFSSAGFASNYTGVSGPELPTPSEESDVEELSISARAVDHIKEIGSGTEKELEPEVEEELVATDEDEVSEESLTPGEIAKKGGKLTEQFLARRLEEYTQGLHWSERYIKDIEKARASNYHTEEITAEKFIEIILVDELLDHYEDEIEAFLERHPRVKKFLDIVEVRGDSVKVFIYRKKF